MRKYKLTDEFITVYSGYLSIKLYRIRALKSFSNITAGDFGGYIQKEDNLSHLGDCWVDEEAYVYGEARVEDNAVVKGFSRVADNSRIYEEAWVEGNSSITDSALVGGSSWIGGYTTLTGIDSISGNTILGISKNQVANDIANRISAILILPE